ncbi:Hint domain-containing protein [Faucicola boevrei]|uniref:Hint domain-containing protein n=1 Tax=Faucicola boevrei TaxID=346665 RepID=UPI000475414B|nr:Hint domain-containing protein [Moraxella boevrei]
MFAKPLNLTANVGVTLDELTKSFSKNESERLIRAIGFAHMDGLTNDKLIQMIRGSKANHFKDGILSTTSRNAQTIARTGTAIMASEAKQAFINQNRDIIKGIKVNARLDRRTCLVAGTLIDTPTGRRPIEQIQKGELVFGGSGKVREVTATLRSYKNRLCKVTLSNGETIVCTQDHRWWNGNEWIEAKDLKIGDFLPRTL